MDGDLTVPSQQVVGKLGVPDSAGWVTWRRGDVSLTLSFDVDPAAEYPDADSPLEIWLELEVLGPLATLAPSGATSLTIRATVGAVLGR